MKHSLLLLSLFVVALGSLGAAEPPLPIVLFILADDLGERNNLAAREPARVKQLDALIEKFLTDTKAVVQVVNPKFDPTKYQPELEGKGEPKAKAAKKAAAKSPVPVPTDAEAESADPLGWKARSCTATVKDGIVTVTGLGSTPFLGVGAGMSGPSVARLRVRGAAGSGKIEWLAAAASSDTRSAPFTLAPGAWQEISVQIPTEGPLGIVRVNLPVQAQPVQVDWIELKSGQNARRWNS